MRTKSTACILCSRNCGLRVETKDDRFVRIKGDEAHPTTKGYICQKAARLAHYQDHADRLRQPRKRMPDGEFVPVSWEQALSEIAERLIRLRTEHGGRSFAFAGGGGQGNHLGGAYGPRQLRAAMDSPYTYNSLAQEKTGDFWVNGRMFGQQSCHTTEDVERSDYQLFIGCNPFQAHGIPNARTVLREMKKDPNRTVVVIDPRVTETAKQADVHLQLKPGTDAYLLSAMIAIILNEGLYDEAFLAKHCTGFESVKAAFLNVDIERYAARADVPLVKLQQVTRGFAQAQRACVRVDLGIQHTLRSTLNGWLEKLLYLLTGNFGRAGVNNLHTSFLPVISHSDEREGAGKRSAQRTAHHKMFPISGLYPPSILPDEIVHDGEDRIRAVWVDSTNPLLTWPDTAAYEQAFSTLDLLVVVDVAMTETARMAHYVLPAASQFEKVEATGFNLEFPDNFFHLRQPLFPAYGDALPEPEIYTRLLVAMGEIPDRFPMLELIARREPTISQHLVYLAALFITCLRNKKWFRYAPSIMYRTLGTILPERLAAAAPLLAVAMEYAHKYPNAVRRAGHRGNRLTLGSTLFRTILERHSGTLVSKHEYEDVWSLVHTDDGRIHLEIAEMLDELAALNQEPDGSADPHYPFVLLAGERRSYNANQIYRDPAWRKTDPDGAMRLHPNDATTLMVATGDTLRCESRRGAIDVIVNVDDSVRVGMVTLPHGYGMRYQGEGSLGPELNRLTASEDCDPLSKTPYHKHTRVRLVNPASTRN